MSDKALLIQKRGRAKGTITRMKAFTDAIPAEATADEISVRLERLKETWSEFCSIEDNLLQFEGQTSEIDEYEIKYFEAQSELLCALRTRSQNRMPHNNDANASLSHLINQQQTFLENLDRSHEPSTSARLPRLNIPYFSGDYKEWPSFQDLFEAAVHNNDSLSACQKFQYLKGLLRGNAASLIRHLTISDPNYDEAWTKLKQRFDKKSQIITSLIKTFLEQPNLNRPSMNALRSMCDLCDEVIRGLKALDPLAETRDPWLIYIVLTKLDADTRESWSKEVIDKNFPTFDELLNFLTKRCDALESCAVVSKRSATTAKSLYSTSLNNKQGCPKCSADHLLYQCEQFKSDSSNNRKAFTISHSVCFKCLGSKHSVKACRSKVRCNQCKGNHHPLLHGASDPNKTSPHSLQKYNPNENQSSCMNSTFNNPDAIMNYHPSHLQASPINPQQSTPSINAQQSTSSINPKLIIPEKPSDSQRNEHFASLNSCIHSDNYPSMSVDEASPQQIVTSLLPTAVVKVRDNQGNFQQCRMLLDSGSQVSLIAESCAQRLLLKRKNARLSISGLSSSGAGITRGKVQLSISSRWEKSVQMEIIALVMNKLTSAIPAEGFLIPEWLFSRDLKLADPCFNTPSSVDIILGADHFFDVLRPNKIFHRGRALAQDTVFGWVLFGNLTETQTSLVNYHVNTSGDLDKSLARFWEIEELSTNAVTLTEEERDCELHFQGNYFRNESGRYVVSLPFRKLTPTLGESKKAAISRLHAMERRFLNDKGYKEEYVKFMREYEQLGHMCQIPADQRELEVGKYFYFPHHAVFKKSPVPKIRVVFDGSCKSSSGVSLNDKLMTGPTIQPDLITTLLRFRRHQIAFSADVEKMYRQVLVSEPDRDFQRIVWREHTSLPIQHYKLNTVTYGTAPASYLATRVLHQIGDDNKEGFPEASSIIQTSFYVDDLLTGAECLADALRLKREITDILQSSGFNLTKWHSNSTEFLQDCQLGHKIPSALPIDDNPNTAKILGIQWEPQNDAFTFNLATLDSTEPTKRRILSEASRIFDPLGWLAPAVISIKILFQQLWLLKLDWDDTLPDHISTKWTNIKQHLPAVQRIKIPRRIYSNINGVQLHGFSDASESAYAAVIYCRSCDQKGVNVRIIASKTKVSPLKQISLPRLELCGALLLARLMDKIIKSLCLPSARVYAWTDSTVVLSWLSDLPRRWKTFVANRTSEILDIIPANQWGHVSSNENPADSASRGLSPLELPNFDLWWNGPSWLCNDMENWASKIPTVPKARVQVEEKRPIVLSCSQEINENRLEILINRCSSFSRIIRIIAHCLRFLSNSRQPTLSRNYNPLSAREVSEAQVVCFKFVQETEFSNEIKNIRAKKPAHFNSKIASLNPFLDAVGLLRVGGRIQNSTYNFNAKHPIILPKTHPITNLLIQEMHRTYLHPGVLLLTGLIRQRFWIIGIRDAVKKMTRKCVTCFRARAATTSQLMGNLPEARVTISRAFLRVGIDYAGPILLCTKVGRGAKSFKGYVSLFICLTTRAIHLEIVNGLTAEAFVAALRRFISRRGTPSEILCDNGTNFVGARKYVKELHEVAMTNAKNLLTSHFLSQFKISWKFIPPGAPHFGGIWEAGVKSVKWHLRRVIGETILSFEEMSTLLCQIECILNSRPYGILSSDPNDLEPLTPSHFLIGEPLTTLPEADLLEVKVSRLGRWQHIQQIMQSFWRRWKCEYITSLQERPKWRSEQGNLSEGDLVLVREDNLPPSKWLIGRITACHPGTDNLVRVVSVRTKRGTFDRPISKIAKLPIS